MCARLLIWRNGSCGRNFLLRSFCGTLNLKGVDPRSLEESQEDIYKLQLQIFGEAPEKLKKQINHKRRVVRCLEGEQRAAHYPKKIFDPLLTDFQKLYHQRKAERRQQKKAEKQAERNKA
eukprot:TRINITY_DN2530_c0_g1_i4.p5 TRINITY_DN2530_c0_g1~~TRINITY_DN2530_c0_g1_i4.p5  ORF type:complete len:120 (-),score=9.02 TRINITY_DN2530_c0_g1_i4:805-1164(-)